MPTSDITSIRVDQFVAGIENVLQSSGIDKSTFFVPQVWAQWIVESVVEEQSKRLMDCFNATTTATTQDQPINTAEEKPVEKSKLKLSFPRSYERPAQDTTIAHLNNLLKEYQEDPEDYETALLQFADGTIWTSRYGQRVLANSLSHIKKKEDKIKLYEQTAIKLLDQINDKAESATVEPSTEPSTQTESIDSAPSIPELIAA
jgi:hypothetical protein